MYSVRVCPTTVQIIKQCNLFTIRKKYWKASRSYRSVTVHSTHIKSPTVLNQKTLPYSL